MYEGQQKKIGRDAGIDLKVPVVYYPQVLGLALGLTSSQLGLKLTGSNPENWLTWLRARNLVAAFIVRRLRWILRVLLPR